MTDFTTDVVEAVTETALEDELVKGAARDLAILAIKKVHHYLEYGTPQFQMAILRSFIPALVREVAKQGGEDENAELKKDLEQLRREVLSGVPGAEDFQ